jgi:formylglycine-generating enzyme required for sulfatase activity
VERVSWDDIQLFLAALNDMDPGKNYRLPTEAEWEFAARAGTTGDYGGTGVLDDMGWYYDNSAVDGVRQTHPVARKQPNHWGLCDMHGNVWGWVQDWYSATSYQYKVDHGIVNDPPGPETGSYRALRGGSWSLSAGDEGKRERGKIVTRSTYPLVGAQVARYPRIRPAFVCPPTIRAKNQLACALPLAPGADGRSANATQAGPAALRGRRAPPPARRPRR